MTEPQLVFEQLNERDIPIAEITGGRNDGTAVYLDQGPCCENCSAKCKRAKQKCCGGCAGGCYIREGVKDFEIEGQGTMLPIPLPTGSQHIFVSGQSGCGKSTWVANYANMYQEVYPKNQVYLISFVPEDGSAIDGIRDLVRLPLKVIVDGEVNARNLGHSLVIFDDVDAMPERIEVPETKEEEDEEKPKKGRKKEADKYAPKEIFKRVEELRDQLLTKGRHSGISVIVTSHLACDAIRTKRPINESQAVVIFPKCGTAHQDESILKKYCGFKPKMIEEVKSLPSRWVMYRKVHPGYILYEKGVYLV